MNTDIRNFFECKEHSQLLDADNLIDLHDSLRDKMEWKLDDVSDSNAVINFIGVFDEETDLVANAGMKVKKVRVKLFEGAINIESKRI